MLPFHQGDTPLQDYNTVLCLAHMQENADGIMWFDNTDLVKMGDDAEQTGSVSSSTKLLQVYSDILNDIPANYGSFFGSYAEVCNVGVDTLLFIIQENTDGMMWFDNMTRSRLEA